MEERTRLMAVDYGERRVGLAVSDPTRTIASPAGFIVRRAGKRPPIAEIIRRAEALGVSGFVLGLPLDGAGEDTPRSLEVRRIAEELHRRTSSPVSLVDERFSTAAALRAIREMEGSTRGRKGDVDALAATILLQQHLGTLVGVSPRRDERADETAEPDVSQADVTRHDAAPLHAAPLDAAALDAAPRDAAVRDEDSPDRAARDAGTRGSS